MVVNTFVREREREIEEHPNDCATVAGGPNGLITYFERNLLLIELLRMNNFEVRMELFQMIVVRLSSLARVFKDK